MFLYCEPLCDFEYLASSFKCSEGRCLNLFILGFKSLFRKKDQITLNYGRISILSKGWGGGIDV